MNEILNEFAPLIKMISDNLEKRINNELKKYDITFSQIRVLFLIYYSKDKIYTLKEIENAFHVSQQTIAGIVKRLEEKNLIYGFMDEEDKRIKRINITKEGDELVGNIQREFVETKKNISKCLDEEEGKVLINLLQKLYIYLIDN